MGGCGWKQVPFGHVPSDVGAYSDKLLDCSYWARGDVFLVIRGCQWVVHSVPEGFIPLEVEHKAAAIEEPQYALNERSREFISPFRRAENGYIAREGDSLLCLLGKL